MKRRIISSNDDVNISPVKAAEGQTKGQEAFEEALDNVQDNFDYAIDGLDKLSRDGGEGQSLALQLALELNSAVDAIIQKIAGNIVQ